MSEKPFRPKLCNSPSHPVSFVWKAVAAGWTRAEAIAALIGLAANAALGDAAAVDMARRLRGE